MTVIKFSFSKIAKVTLVLTLAFLFAFFLGEKVFIPGTLIVRPKVRWSLASFPSRTRQTASEILRKLTDFSFLPKFGLKKPSVSPTPSPAAQPPPGLLTPTTPPYIPSPTPTTVPAVPPLSPTPLPPTSTPYPTATPSAPPSVTLAQFAQCLTSRGLKMYGTPGCGYCAQQRNMFGAAFSYITEIDCTQQTQLCREKGIAGYPTWEDGGGTLHPGVQSFSSLSQISGCPAPS